MPIVGAAWSSTLFGDLAGRGLVGSRLSQFTDAVGNGSSGHVVGKPFATMDTGAVPGNGAGAGVGIMGFSANSIAQDIFNDSVGSFGQSGSRLMDICDALGATCVTEMGLATLTSVHFPVFAGVGTIVPGSVGVVGSAWGSSISSVGTGEDFIGSDWNNFALAIGRGQATPILASGTGVVTITGSPISSPSPGSGSGTGVIS